MAWPLLARARARALRSLFRWQRMIYRACLSIYPEHLPALCRGRHNNDSCDGPWTAGWPVAGQCVACTTFLQQMEQNVKQHYPTVQQVKCKPKNEIRNRNNTRTNEKTFCHFALQGRRIHCIIYISLSIYMCLFVCRTSYNPQHQRQQQWQLRQ